MEKPQIAVSYSGLTIPIVGNPGSDPRKLYYSFSSPSGLITGWYGTSGEVEGQFYYSSTGFFQSPISVVEIRPAKSKRNYQPRPEDRISTDFRYTLVDSYPWRRPLIAGGEDCQTAVECAEKQPANKEYADLECYLEDETGLLKKAIIVSAGHGEIGYPVFVQPTKNFGQRAYGFKIPGSYPAKTAQSSITISDLDSTVLGEPYVLGLVKGIVVADPTKHWTRSHRDSLAAWFHLGEHPQQPYTIHDKSPYALSQEELQSGKFDANYALSSRKWDAARGWVLDLQCLTTTKPAEKFTVSKQRLDGLDFAVSFWIKPGPWIKDSAETTVFQYGHLAIKHGSTSGRHYLKAFVSDGAQQVQIGRPFYLTDNLFSYYGLSFKAVLPKRTIRVAACASDNIANLSGLAQIDGVALSPTDLVLLIDQDDPAENGCYSVTEGGWYRLAEISETDETGLYYDVVSGSENSGLYRCMNEGPISYGADSIAYSKVTAEWTGSASALQIASITRVSTTATATTTADHGLDIGDIVEIEGSGVSGYDRVATVTSVPTSDSFTYEIVTDPGQNSTSGQVIVWKNAFCNARKFSALDENLTVSAPSALNASSLAFSDVRLWSDFKSQTDHQAVKNPAVRKTAIAVRPTFVKASDGSFQTFKVLDSGYAYPSTWPVDYSTLLTARNQYYTGLGEYEGPEHRVLVGYGDAKPDPTDLPLGYVGSSMSSSGKSIAASNSSNLPGYSSFWHADATTGFYRRVVLPTANPNVDNSSLVSNPSSSYHPAEVRHQNPSQTRIYVKGEDNNMYRIHVSVTKVGSSQTADLVATLAGRCENQASILGTAYLFDGYSTIQVSSSSSLYDLTVEYSPDELYNREFLSDAATVLSRSGQGRVAVQVQSGVPVVTKLSDTGLSTAPAYIYSNADTYLKYDLASNLNPWINQDASVSQYLLPNRDLAGPLIFQGSQTTIEPGSYRLVIDATDYAEVDSDFSGFEIEVGISALSSTGQTLAGSKIASAVVVQNGTPEFSISYKYGGLTAESKSQLACCTVSEFQQAVSELDGATGGITVLSTTTYPSTVGGPFWIQFDDPGAQTLLKIGATLGMTAVVTRVVAGNDTDREIQKIEFRRPLTVVEFDVDQEIVFDSSRYWTLQVYLSTSAAAPHRLLIHNLWLYRLNTRLFKVEPSSSGIVVQEVTVSDSDTASTKPGGFKSTAAIDGTVSNVHEMRSYDLGPTKLSSFASDLPHALTITGSTQDRQDFVYIKSGYQPADGTDPVSPVSITPEFLVGSPSSMVTPPPV